jgi:hypothetical protein
MFGIDKCSIYKGYIIKNVLHSDSILSSDNTGFLFKSHCNTFIKLKQILLTIVSGLWIFEYSLYFICIWIIINYPFTLIEIVLWICFDLFVLFVSFALPLLLPYLNEYKLTCFMRIWHRFPYASKFETGWEPWVFMGQL